MCASAAVLRRISRAPGLIICLTRGDDVVAVHALDMVGAGVAMAPASGPAARSGLLRLPGSVLRRLPVVVVPDPGESLGSWVDRVAARAEVPPGQAAVALGLEIRGRGSGVLPVLYGITLTAASRAGLAASTGLDPLRCENRPEGGRWCPYWLTGLATVAVSPAVVRAQHGVLAVAEGTDVRVGGRPVTARMWFAFLRFVTGLVRLAAMVEFVSSCPQVPAEAVD